MFNKNCLSLIKTIKLHHLLNPLAYQKKNIPTYTKHISKRNIKKTYTKKIEYYNKMLSSIIIEVVSMT